MSTPNKIAIFASGRGSNAKAIFSYFEAIPEISVELIVSNRKNAGILEWAEKQEIDRLIIKREMFYESEDLLEILSKRKISHIVLAGFLWIVPKYLIQKYEGKILNIHPALLPKYGGKGMYGHHVHQAVFDNHEKESGISIHLVNEKYDEGKILFQASCKLDKNDNPDSIAEKVLALEHHFYPRVIHTWILEK